MAAPTIASGLKQLLARYMPFSSMTPEHLNFVIEHVDVAYFEPGETILGPSAEPPSHCYIVKQGRVQGETTNEKRGEVAFEAGVQPHGGHRWASARRLGLKTGARQQAGHDRHLGKGGVGGGTRHGHRNRAKQPNQIQQPSEPFVAICEESLLHLQK